MAKVKNHLQPARSVIDKLGGTIALADRLGLAASTVSRWAMPKNKAGHGGSIPQKHWKKLIAVAEKQGKRLTLKELSGIS